MPSYATTSFPAPATISSLPSPPSINSCPDDPVILLDALEPIIVALLFDCKRLRSISVTRSAPTFKFLTVAPPVTLNEPTRSPSTRTEFLERSINNRSASKVSVPVSVGVSTGVPPSVKLSAVFTIMIGGL